MNASIQRRDRTSRTPPLSSARKSGAWSGGCGARGGSRMTIRNPAETTNVAASMATAAPGLSTTISTPAAAGPSTWPAFMARPISALACCSSDAGTSRGHQPARRGAEERLEAAVDGDERDQVPQLRRAGQQQRGDRRLHEAATHVRDQHQPPPRHPVGPHAGDQHERGHRDDLRGEHEAELRRRAVQPVEDGERERDREQRVAEHRDRLAGEQQAEVAVAQDGRPEHGGTLRVRAVARAQRPLARQAPVRAERSSGGPSW